MAMSLERHAALLRTLSQPGGALSTTAPQSTLRNRAYFTSRGKAKAERLALHDTIAHDVLKGVGNQYLAIMVVGPPGAGKSTARQQALSTYPDHTFAVLDNDNLKVKLLQASLDAGTFKDDFYTPEIHRLESAGHIFHPLEFASLVHNEAAKIMRSIEAAAVNKGLNLLIDGVGASETSARNRLASLEAAGYTTHIIDVECSRETSQQAIIHRWQQGRTEALNTTTNSHLGGRWVPSEVLSKVFPTPSGISEPERIHDALAKTHRSVHSYQLWRRSSPTAAHTLEQDLVRAHHGATLIDKDAAQALNTAFGVRPRPHQRSTDPGQGL